MTWRNTLLNNIYVSKIGKIWLIVILEKYLKVNITSYTLGKDINYYIKNYMKKTTNLKMSVDNKSYKIYRSTYLISFSIIPVNFIVSLSDFTGMVKKMCR